MAMHIEASSVRVAAEGQSQVRQERTAQVRAWVEPPRDTLALSSPVPATAPADDETLSNPKLMLLKLFIEALTGEKIKTIDASDLRTTPASAPAPAAPARPAWGIEANVTTTTAESQQLAIAARGTVTTTDGRKIAFDLQLDVAQAHVATVTQRLLAGQAATDPLVLNLEGGFTGALSEARFTIDLDRDGTAETPHALPAGRGFLALDRNGNGAVDDGGELFGPTSGNGFSELLGYDADGNGWIDSADPVFSALDVWTPGAAPQSLTALGIGAISVASASAPFALKDAANTLTGANRAVGLFLRENGTPGTVQQIDLVG
jgi:hypothetical protein